MKTVTRHSDFRLLAGAPETLLAPRRRRWATAPLLVFALAAGGCGVVTALAASSSESSQTAEPLQSHALAAPPRSIDDITAILDGQKRAANPKAAKRDAFTEKQPPKNAKPAKLANFFRAAQRRQ